MAIDSKPKGEQEEADDEEEIMYEGTEDYPNDRISFEMMQQLAEQQRQERLKK